jgi:osmoprotectant transport system permease protein
MMPAITEALAELPPLLRAHLLLSGAGVGIAVAAGLPLAIAAAHRPAVRTPLLAIVGLIQTIPTLALLALFYPMLIAIRAGTGLAIPALGFLPALIALALYALLPIVRNGIAAIEGIAPSVIEAADGIGMTRRQRLAMIELPLGAPVMLAGIRTACVWTIGAATLATTVGQASLGNLIFSGLQTENWVRVLVGCAAAAVLALAADGMLALIEAGVMRRSRMRIGIGIGLLVSAAVLAFGAGASSAGGGPVIVIGAKNFAEQYILASAIENRLVAAGYRTERRDDLGSAVAYRALASGGIDVYVDYTGTLWTNVLGRSDVPPPARMRAELAAALAARDGVVTLGSLGFENAYALAMKRTRAKALGIASLADLRAHAPRLRLGSDLEFLSRPEWRAVAARYGLAFRDARSYSPTFMYRALADGSVDAISAFSSDGRIAAHDLVTLADPLGALPSYDAVLMLAPKHARDRRLAAALRPLIGAIPIERMRQANLMVDRDVDKATPAQAANWLVGTRRNPPTAR